MGSFYAAFGVVGLILLTSLVRLLLGGLMVYSLARAGMAPLQICLVFTLLVPAPVYLSPQGNWRLLVPLVLTTVAPPLALRPLILFVVVMPIAAADSLAAAFRRLPLCRERRRPHASYVFAGGAAVMLSQIAKAHTERRCRYPILYGLLESATTDAIKWNCAAA